MRLAAILTLLLATTLAHASAPPDPHLAAHWTRPGQALISWTQQPGARLTCLARNQALIRCWQGLAAGPMRLALGGALTDFRDRPAAGDVYRLWLDGVETRAALRSEARLPVVRR